MYPDEIPFEAGIVIAICATILYLTLPNRNKK